MKAARRAEPGSDPDAECGLFVTDADGPRFGFAPSALSLLDRDTVPAAPRRSPAIRVGEVHRPGGDSVSNS